MTTTPPLFQETLRGVPRWLGVLLMLAGVTTALTVLVLSREHLTDPVFWLAAGPAIAAAILAPWAIATWRLETEVRPGTLALELHPFSRREVRLSDVESCEPTAHSPFRHALERGWHVGRAGRVLFVPGRRGARLILRDGERLLVSSAEPERLALAIQTARADHD